MADWQKSLLQELEESNGPRELNDEELAFVKWQMSDLLDYHELKKEQYKKHRTGESSPLLQEWKRLRGHVIFTENLRKLRNDRNDNPVEEADLSAFVPMSDLWQEKFKSAAECSRFLDKNHQEIRSNRPSQRRRDVHSGDWIRYWKEYDRKQSESLDDETIEEFLAGKEAQEEKERERKKRRK